MSRLARSPFTRALLCPCAMVRRQAHQAHDAFRRCGNIFPNNALEAWLDFEVAMTVTIPFRERLSCTIAEACAATGIGRTKDVRGDRRGTRSDP
jgi:hypothetical protein